jgi:argininosuccinate synthase
MKKVLLAFSGGLDTSYCAVHLSRIRQLEVHTVTINTGGFTVEELSEIEKRAYALGSVKHTCIDVTNSYYRECIKYLVFGNILKNNTYPLSVSAERISQAIAIARHARRIAADYVAHGSTGAGNDQVRFDMIFNILIPEIEILTPIRDMKLSREQEIEFLKAHGVEMNFAKAKYSINKGIWGTSVGGKETLTSFAFLPEEAFPTQVTNTRPADITLHFEHGELVGVNDIMFENPVDAIKELDRIAAPYGIGRDVHVGDTIIGIKGRVGFEAAAPVIIIKAHHTLEKHVLTKWQLYWKDQLAMWYGNWLHEGQFLDPVMRNMEAFFDDTQKKVNGKVFVHLAPYRFQVTGIESPNDLMSAKFGSYGEMNNAWTGDDVKGFTKIFGNQVAIYHKVNEHAAKMAEFSEEIA